MLTEMRKLLDAAKSISGDFAVYALEDLLEQVGADLYDEVLHDLAELRLAIAEAEAAFQKELLRK
jgi:hypothetical protein